MHHAASGTFENSNFLWKSPDTGKLLIDSKKFARSDSPVLIPGESGTGKELLAESTSKNPYFVFSLIFFLAATLSKCSRNQVRTTGAKLRGTHRQPLNLAPLLPSCIKKEFNQVRTTGAKLRGTHRQPLNLAPLLPSCIKKEFNQVRTTGAKLRGTHRQPLNLAPLLPSCIKKEFNQVRTAGAKLRGTHRHCAKFQKRFFRGCPEYIHFYSRRPTGPIIRVNCAAFPGDLIESELFGSIQGAKNDSIKDRTGCIEQADGGNILLNEIAELSLPVQAKLLRVLQAGFIQRIGESFQTKVDVRIIAATNGDLKNIMRKSGFRKDLYYRLVVFVLEIPPLRDRPEDIEVFLGKSTITPDDLIIEGKSVVDYSGRVFKDSIAVFKKNLIRESLKLHEGNRTRMAMALGIQRTYLSRMLKELSITYEKEKQNDK